MMKLSAYLTGLALIVTSAAAAAQEAAPTRTLSIAPGETVTARIADDGAGFVELGRTRGGAQGERAANTIRFSFSGIGGMLMLLTENGYGRAFNYRARMFIRGRSADTSICTVMPGISTFESWGDPIERLELREPRLSDAAEMTCR